MARKQAAILFRVRDMKVVVAEVLVKYRVV